MLRDLIRISSEITEAAYRPQGQATHELLDDAERRIFEIAERGNADRWESVAIKDVLAGVMAHIDELSGVTTRSPGCRPDSRTSIS